MPPLPDRSKENTQTERDTLVLQVGGWVDGPAPHHPEKNTHAKRPRQRLGKTDGLSNERHKAPKRLMNYGTWNVQGIRGKMEETTSELGKLKMDVIGLTETKRNGTGSEIVGGYVQLHSGVSKDRRAERGVSILIKKKFEKGITNLEAVNENVITVNINHLGIKITVLCVYASPNDKVDL